jgi:hypothetical protein
MNRAGFRRKRNNGNMKKTTKRGAYNKYRKKAMVTRRAPLVETKKCELQDIVGATIGGFVIPESLPFKQVINGTNVHYFTPHNYYAMTQGVQTHQMLGDKIFCKYLNMKIAVRFPNSEDALTSPNEYELIWGWCKNSPCPNGMTQPKLSQYNSLLIEAHVLTQTGPFFNAKGDRLKWRPKDDKNLKIIGTKKVRPDNRFSSTYPLVNQYDTTGAVPDYETQVSWKPMRKLLYEKAAPGGNNAYVLTQDWIPFCALYMPFNHDATTGVQLPTPQVAYNTIMYYSDS